MPKGKSNRLKNLELADDKIKDKIADKILSEIADIGLTENEQDFVLYYLDSNNSSQSYLKVFGGDKKYSYVRGCTLLHKPKIQMALKKLKKIISIGLDIDPLRYIEAQLKIANADIGDYIKFSEDEVPLYNDDGSIAFDPDTGEQKFKKINKMHLVDSETVDTSVIAGIKQGRDGISIQLMDKMKAWENIKNFFEWKAQKKAEESVNNNILEALGNSAKSSWGNTDVNSDLMETLKEDI